MIETLRLSWSIVIRNWTVYRKDLIANISPTVADPALTMVSLGLGLAPFVQNLGDRSYLAFLAPGMVAASALFTSFFESSYGFYVRLTFESVFKAMLTTPIGAREVILGEFIWNFLKGAGMALGVGTFLSCFGLAPGIIYLPLIALLGGLIALPCAAMGLLSCTFVQNMNQFQSVYSFIIAPIYFLSGIFFPLEAMPTYARWAVLSPFANGVRLMQMLFWQEAKWQDILWHGGFLFLMTVLLMTWASRRVYRKLIL